MQSTMSVYTQTISEHKRAANSTVVGMLLERKDLEEWASASLLIPNALPSSGVHSFFGYPEAHQFRSH